MCLGWLHTGWPASGKLLRFRMNLIKVFTASVLYRKHLLQVLDSFFSDHLATREFKGEVLGCVMTVHINDVSL